MSPVIGITCSTLDSDTTPRVRHAVNGTYIQWVERCGGTPVLLPNIDAAHAPRMLRLLDGLLASGGDDVHPLEFGAEPERKLGEIDVPRDRFELPLLRLALADGLPILGICRGIQALNVAAGGDLRQDLEFDPTVTVQHRMKARGAVCEHHTVDLTPGSRLEAVLGTTRLAVNSYHHQAVGRLGAGLRACAGSTDGVIEALESTEAGRWLLAVQWHPEMMPAGYEPTERLFGAFLAAAREHAERRAVAVS